MIRVLSVHEDLEAKRKALEIAMNRPAYVVPFPLHVASDMVFREPDEADYRKRSEIDLYLGQWEGSCVERIDYEEFTVRRNGSATVVPAHTVRKFDLKKTNMLRLACPVPERTRVEFRKITGIPSDLNDQVTISIREGDALPDELLPFVREAKLRGTRRGLGITFQITEPFLRPMVTVPNWHAGQVQPNHTWKEWKTGVVTEFAHSGGTLIQAPGQYPAADYSIGPGAPWNHMMACTREPGPCVVCRGASSEWRHLGSVAFGPGGVSANGLVCKTCLPQAFEQWLQIVSALNITAGEVKPKTGEKGTDQ